VDQAVWRWPGENTLADGGPVAALEAIAEHRTAEVGGADAALNEVLPTRHLRHRARRCRHRMGRLSLRRGVAYPAVAHRIGDKPGGFGAYRDGFKDCRRAAPQNEEIVVLSDVSHYDLYGQPNRAGPALVKVIPFLAKTL
jgi:uncharacterized protein